MPSLLFSSTLKDLNAQEDCGIPITVKDMSMLPSKTDQMKASQETGSDANIGFGRDLMPSYLGKHPLNAAHSAFRRSPGVNEFLDSLSSYIVRSCLSVLVVHFWFGLFCFFWFIFINMFILHLDPVLFLYFFPSGTVIMAETVQNIFKTYLNKHAHVAK